MKKTLPKNSLRKKSPYLELFWSVLFRIWTEYVEIRSSSPYSEIRSISLYSAQLRENTDQNNSEYGHFLSSASGAVHVDSR